MVEAVSIEGRGHPYLQRLRLGYREEEAGSACEEYCWKDKICSLEVAGRAV